MGIEKVCDPLFQYFSENKYLRILVPLDIYLMFIGAIGKVLNLWISFGGIVTNLFYLSFVIGAVMVFSRKSWEMLSYGLVAYGVNFVVGIVKSVVLSRYHFVPWGSIFMVLVYGGLAYLAYNKHLSTKS
jgi:hypothetical protein